MNPLRTLSLLLCSSALTLGSLGCASAPETQPAQHDLEAEADATIAEMARSDSSLPPLLADAEGFVVFPTVGEGAVVAGAANGVGVLYESGRPIGYAELREGSFGAQVGGQAYSQLVVFRSERALEAFKREPLEFSAEASATVLTEGAAASAPFADGRAVFIDDESGAMVEASVAGQVIRYEPES